MPPGQALYYSEAKEALRRAAHELRHRVLVEARELPRCDHARRLRVRGRRGAPRRRRGAVVVYYY